MNKRKGEDLRIPGATPSALAKSPFGGAPKQPKPSPKPAPKRVKAS